MRIVPLTLEHMHRLPPEQIVPEASYESLLKIGVGYSLIRGEEVLGYGGVIRKWNGVGEVWIVTSNELRQRPLLLIRHTKRIIQMIFAGGNFHRLEMHVVSENVTLKRWAESLGFTFEGTMLKYGPDAKNHDLYSLT